MASGPGVGTGEAAPDPAKVRAYGEQGGARAWKAAHVVAQTWLQIGVPGWDQQNTGHVRAVSPARVLRELQILGASELKVFTEAALANVERYASTAAHEFVGVIGPFV